LEECNVTLLYSVAEIVFTDSSNQKIFHHQMPLVFAPNSEEGKLDMLVLFVITNYIS